MTNPGEQRPILNNVSGLEPMPDSQLPGRDVVPIAPENVTPQMWNHAMFSPGNPNSLQQGRVEQAQDTTPTQAAGVALEGAGMQLDMSTEAGPVQGPLTAKEYVEKAEDEASKDGKNPYDHLFDPNYNAALDAVEGVDSQAPATPVPDTGYTPSASIGKSWEQVQGVQRAIDAQRVAEGKETAYYSSEQPK